jgi:arginase family enzyme
MSVASANKFAVSGGLTVEDVEYALSQIAQHLRIAGVTLSAYDPDADIQVVPPLMPPFV